jgi:hypothetical protein
METFLPLFENFTLKLSRDPSSGKEFSTAALQKGLLLCRSVEELSEEAVGFGVPVIQRGLTSVFPSRMEWTTSRNGSHREIDAVYHMNLVERIGGPDRSTQQNTFIYALKNHLARMYRRFPSLQGPLTGISSALRGIFRWQVVYEEGDYSSMITMKYRAGGEPGRILIEAEMTDLNWEGVTEVAVMNEQGGRNFARYRDSSGLILTGNTIDGWNEVRAETASFICDRHRVAFTLHRMPGAKLFRGRELVGARLAWSGFGYLLPPQTWTFEFSLKVEKEP